MPVCTVSRLEVTENGGAILENEKVKKVTRYTGKVEDVCNKETKNYTREELNRSIINPAQIKLFWKLIVMRYIRKCSPNLSVSRIWTICLKRLFSH